MTVNIAQMHANEDKARSDIRFESRKFVVKAIVAAAAVIAASVSAGVGIGGLIWAHGSRDDRPAPPVIFPPGTVITIPNSPISLKP